MNIDNDEGDDEDFNALAGPAEAQGGQMTWSRSIWWCSQDRALSPDLSVVLLSPLVHVALRELVSGIGGQGPADRQGN